MIDVLTIWESELENLPKEKTSSWAANFAQWYADRVANLQTDPASLDHPDGSAINFSFNTSAFQQALVLLGPTTDAAQGIGAFADAWEAAISASVVAALVQSFIPPSSPTTLFSAITSTTIDSASISSGKAKIIELASEPVPSGGPSQFPKKFRDATLLLTITVVGFDSTPSGSGGPLPLTASAVPVV